MHTNAECLLFFIHSSFFICYKWFYSIYYYFWRGGCWHVIFEWNWAMPLIWTGRWSVIESQVFWVLICLNHQAHLCWNTRLSKVALWSVWWNKWNQMLWRALQFGIRLRWGWSIKWPNYCLMVLSVTPVVAMHDCFIYLLEFLCCFINIFYRLLFSCCTFKVDPQIRNMLFLSVFHFRNSIFVFHLIMLLSMPTHIISIVCCRASWGACGWVCMRDWTARAKGLFESPKRDLVSKLYIYIYVHFSFLCFLALFRLICSLSVVGAYLWMSQWMIAFNLSLVDEYENVIYK